MPDLSDFISVIYVNEVDISKVKKGQNVSIKVDAFPEKTFDGFVSDVANIGQQLRNQDAKVFEVTVQINEVDSVLRPAMTTSNDILVYNYDDVLSIPLEAFYKRDSIQYVIKKDGNNYIKQEVVAHVSNDDEIMIVAGLSEDDVVCLTAPDLVAELSLEYLDESVRMEALESIKVVSNERREKESEWAKRAKDDVASRDQSSSPDFIIIN